MLRPIAQAKSPVDLKASQSRAEIVRDGRVGDNAASLKHGAIFSHSSMPTHTCLPAGASVCRGSLRAIPCLHVFQDPISTTTLRRGNKRLFVSDGGTFWPFLSMSQL